MIRNFFIPGHGCEKKGEPLTQRLSLTIPLYYVYA